MAGSRHLNIVMPGNAQPSKAAAQKPKYLKTHAALQHKRGLVVCVEGFRKRRGRGRGEGKGIHAAQQECHEEDGADGSYVALHATDGRPQASQSRVEQRAQGYKTNIDGNEGGQVGSKSYRSQPGPCVLGGFIPQVEVFILSNNQHQTLNSIELLSKSKQTPEHNIYDISGSHQSIYLDSIRHVIENGAGVERLQIAPNLVL